MREDQADLEERQFRMDNMRNGLRKSIERAILTDPGLSLEVKLIIKKIIDAVR